MRVTFGSKYNQMNNYQNALQNKINDANTQIASGLKIRYGYQNSDINNQNLKFQYEENTLDQGIDVAQNAYTSTLNTDKALQEFSKTMEAFKTKLIQSANDVHSETSRAAIANDLERLREHMINVANTSIGGEFLFGGSKVDRPPIDSNGKYHGNGEDLNALISSDNLVPYNISGQDLFLGADKDKHKLITTNIKLLNQNKLHPDVMDALEHSSLPEEVFIKPSDTLRELIGDNDKDPTNDPKEFFYLQGVRPDGSSFKEKFALSKAYQNQESASKVSDLLDKIAHAYGNTSQNKVVDVSLNNWGQIEIKNLTPGSENLDFHLISSDGDFDDLDALRSSGKRVTEYVKSAFVTDRSLSQVKAVPNMYNPKVLEIPSVFVTKDNVLANKNTKLSEIFGDKVETLKINASRLDNSSAIKIPNLPINLDIPILLDVKNSTIKDLKDAIKERFNNEVDVEIATNGRLRIIDNSSKESPISLALSTLDQKGLEVAGIPTNNASEYQKTYFNKEGAKLESNVAQIAQNGAANGSTKLSEVAKGSLENSVFNMKLNDVNGSFLKAQMILDNNGAFLSLPNGVKIPLYDPTTADIQASKPNEVTYRQLMDAMSIALNYSNTDPAIYQQISDNPTSKESKERFIGLLKQAKDNLSVNLNEEGKVIIQDNMHSNTKMQFMLFDKDANDFSQNALHSDKPSLKLNANNALIIDKPSVNFFDQLENIITSVRKGIYRPDALGDTYSSDMRNLGIQNGITLIDHLSDHIEKMIAKNGAHGKAFENIIRRNEVLKTQVQSIRGETTGTDMAETYNKFSNLTNNYNAVLASTNKINNLSLTKYL
ncbi:flagellar hook-associated protein FlgL [Helicobacter pylori]|uniref:flagellar hook-associated protein FlgL n=1 Tax=Helicobacter pylori TaxID=210 RepID=UPI000E279E45|nr:flagellar hook-associated protein FlgL [Helicobacter pylori]RDY78473.1 flagellar hook-associated protein FlgL [Helicobacter pylori]RDY81742.1 flagellar hook-associated protein FlgL [Helicobacter pylori]RDY81949.1 flagellar hook-associated protein FlgL [Helicobacter pylori]WQX56688.1 flagellar hook-associated protein FlgL [Helicobacter pylori]